MTHVHDFSIITGVITDITDAEFNTISDEHSRFMLKNAHQAISLTESWDFMRTFSEQSSFMFSNSPIVSDIMKKMSELGYDGHSGCSFAWTMRQMEFLAKNGKQAFLQQFV
jgi:hypothetical protein